MNLGAVESYASEVLEQYNSGHAKEHGYRPALQKLLSTFPDVVAVNDPKRSLHGNPDFVFLKKSHQNIILGYAETKDIDIDLGKTENTEQLKRYSGYDNLFLTNNLEFRFYKNGEKYQTVRIGDLIDGHLVLA
ncbi:MAG: Adenine specific DNA methyltransferase, partial [Berkelbacteria bacterium GW2011_GWA2_46_7]